MQWTKRETGETEMAFGWLRKADVVFVVACRAVACVLPGHLQSACSVPATISPSMNRSNDRSGCRAASRVQRAYASAVELGRVFVRSGLRRGGRFRQTTDDKIQKGGSKYQTSVETTVDEPAPARREINHSSQDRLAGRPSETEGCRLPKQKGGGRGRCSTREMRGNTPVAVDGQLSRADNRHPLRQARYQCLQVVRIRRQVTGGQGKARQAVDRWQHREWVFAALSSKPGGCETAGACQWPM